MNRDEFLFKVFKMYQNTFNNENIEIWKSAYEVILKNNWDYDLLWRKFITDYTSTNIAPAPAFFKDYRKDVEIKKEIVKEEETEGVPPPKEILELKAKLQANTQTKSDKMKGEENVELYPM